VCHLLGDDGQAVWQGLTTNAASFFYHEIVSAMSFAVTFGFELN
jgi:hypothetical protein